MVNFAEIVSAIHVIADELEGELPIHFSYTGDAERAQQDPYCPVKLHAINCCDLGCYNRTTDLSKLAKYTRDYYYHAGLPPFTMSRAIWHSQSVNSPGVGTIGGFCKGSYAMALINSVELHLPTLLAPSAMQRRRDQIDDIMADIRSRRPEEYSKIMNTYPLADARYHLFRKMEAIRKRMNMTELSRTINLSEQDRAAGRWKTVHIYDGNHNQSDAVLGAFVDGSIETKEVLSDGDGWRSLEVFVHPYYQFARGHRIADIPGQYHGQVLVELSVLTVLKFFHRHYGGFFLDFGAYEPVLYSNTRTLERDFSWRGILIDGQSEKLPNLAQRDCTVISAVITNETNSTVTFKQHGDDGGELSGILDLYNTSAYSTLDSSPRINTTIHSTISLRDILKRFDAPLVIDFLSLDCEGCEESSMEGFPWESHMILTAAVERPSAKLEHLFASNGLALVGKHGDFGDNFYINLGALRRNNIDLQNVAQALQATGSPELYLASELRDASTMDEFHFGYIFE